MSCGSNIWTLTDDPGASGTDTLRNVERLRFSTGLQLLDIEQGRVGGAACRIYKAALDRRPDNGGLKYWVGRMDASTNVTDVAANVILSAELRALYGNNPSDGDFINRLYVNVLGRASEADSYNYWMGELRRTGRKSRQQVLVSFSKNDENVNNVAATMANGIYLVD